VWVPCLKRVVSTRDVTFNETKFYSLSYDNLIQDQVPVPTTQIDELLEPQDHIDQVPRILEPPPSAPTVDPPSVVRSPPDLPAPSDSTDKLVPYDESRSQTQLQTPAPSPEPESDSASTQGVPTPPTPGDQTSDSVRSVRFVDEESSGGAEPPNSSPDQADDDATPSAQLIQEAEAQESKDRTTKYREIGLDLNPSNILEGKRVRRRREAYLAALFAGEDGFNAAFSSTRIALRTKPHQTQLPQAPKRWKDLLRHPISEQFKAAAHTE
jgi:hypothetical protein